MTAPAPAGADGRRWAALAAVLAGTFVGTINNSVANVAVLDVLDDFDIGLGAGVWFVTAYVLAFAVLMPAAGRLADVVGVQRVYSTGLALFAVASAAVALAPSYPFAVGARVAQGVTNAPVLPAVMVTVVHAFSPGVRGRAMGIWAATNGAAIALGPPLGGVVADAFGWRAIFWADVPLAVVAIVLARRYLPADQPQPAAQPDVVGGALLSVGLVGVMLGLSRAPDWGIASASTLLLVGAGGVALAAFWRRSRRVAEPFLAVAVLRNRAYAALSAVAALQMVVLFAVLFTTPLFLSAAWDYRIGETGVLIFALPLAMVLAGPSMGSLADRFGAARLTRAGGAVMVLACAVLAGSVLVTSLAVIIAGLLLLGVGVSGVQSPTAVGVAEQVDDDQRGGAMGLFHTTRFLAGVLGTAAAATLLTAVAGDRLGGGDEALDRAFLLAYGLAGAAALGVVVLSRLVPAADAPTAGPRLAADPP